ncbi:MAG: hypothetical protein Q7R42_05845 [Candidatus Planktophila sp.]|nr:hypothetical protein [Candidatus Planktophila sp.]
MKRGLLIAGGTLGGLGAVMSITPPQFSTTDSMSMAGIGAISSGAVPATPSTSATSATSSSSPANSSSATATPRQSATKAATPTQSATKAAATKTTANSNSNSNSNTGNTATNPTPAAVATTAAPTPAPAGVSGTFVGPSVFVQYGNVQVRVTVVNGRITDAQAIVAPTGKNDRYTNMAVPVLKKQTLVAQSANIQGASGASYTSYGWFKSLQGALANAGM